MIVFWISEVPSPMSMNGASRMNRADAVPTPGAQAPRPDLWPTTPAGRADTRQTAKDALRPTTALRTTPPQGTARPAARPGAGHSSRRLVRPRAAAP